MNFTVATTLLVSVAALAGCSTRAGVQSSAGPEMIAPEKALIFPPPGGPEMIAVVNRTYSNAVEQQVFLRADARTPGQNFMKVSLYGPQTAENTGKDSLPFTGFRASSLAREIRAEFPGASMSMSADYLQNSYGSFSYAAGHGVGNDACLYGWQDIRSPERARQGMQNLGRIKVRVRVCQAGATTQQLLSMMYNYTITGGYGTDSWNPYGTPLKPEEGIGRSGRPIYPVATNEFPMQPGVQTSATVASVRPAPRAARPAPAVTPSQMQQQPVRVSGQSVPAIPSPTGLVAAPSVQRTVATPAAEVVIPSPGCLSQAGGGQRCN